MAASKLKLLDNSGDGPLRVPGFGGVEINLHVDLEDDVGAERESFAHGAVPWTPRSRLTAREIAMLGVMNALTDKANWHEKIFNKDIVAKWKAEALVIPHLTEKAWDWCVAELQDKASLYQETKSVLILDSCSRVSKSDELIPSTLQDELKAAVGPLLERDEKDWHPGSDDQVLNLVHPSLFPLVMGKTPVLVSGGKVGVADCLGTIGQGSAVPGPEAPITRRGYWERNTEDLRWSRRFQWLPCEVEFVGDEGTDVRVTSYINNLHPRHDNVYRVVEKVIGHVIKPWNDVLQYIGLAARQPPRIRTYGVGYDVEAPEWLEKLWSVEKGSAQYKASKALVREYIATPEEGQTVEEARRIADGIPKPIPEAMSVEDTESRVGTESAEDASAAADEGEEGNPDWEDVTEDEDDDDDERIDHNWEETHGLYYATQLKYARLRKVVHPDPGESFSYEEWKKGTNTGKPVIANRWAHADERDHEYYDIKLQEQFRQKGLQVIVKLASIELTPEKPKYAGGSWHIEGLLNEHIAATAIYYYDVDNVTESRIRFRTEATFGDDDGEETMDYEQGVHSPIAQVFGVEERYLNGVAAVQERGSVATPAGRLLAFPNTLQHRVEPFELADRARPGHRRFLVLWLVDPHRRVCSTRNVPPQQHAWWREGGLDRVDFGALPQELVDLVRGEIGEWPMGMEEAKALRLELMAERTRATEQIESYMPEYNFCEH
jgi:hypothetical protein